MHHFMHLSSQFHAFTHLSCYYMTNCFKYDYFNLFLRIFTIMFYPCIKGLLSSTFYCSSTYIIVLLIQKGHISG